MLVAKRKEWDSDFFGYEVWELRGSEFNAAELKEQLDHLKNKKARLVYLFTKEEFPGAGEWGARLVDKKVLFEKELNGMPSKIEGISSLPSSGNEIEIEELALESGAYSRFRIDPQFRNNEFERLYSRWIKASVDRSIADDVLVYKEGDNYLGLVTVSLKDKTVWIGLIAVKDGQRGKNIGSKLIKAAENFGLQHGCKKLDVYTQLDNEQACNFYQKNGYNIASLDHIYHIWLTD